MHINFSKIPSLCWEFVNFREHKQDDGHSTHWCKQDGRQNEKETHWKIKWRRDKWKDGCQNETLHANRSFRNQGPKNVHCKHVLPNILYITYLSSPISLARARDVNFCVNLSISIWRLSENLTAVSLSHSSGGNAKKLSTSLSRSDCFCLYLST